MNEIDYSETQRHTFIRLVSQIWWTFIFPSKTTITSHSNDNFKSQVFCKIQGASWLYVQKNLVSPFGCWIFFLFILLLSSSLLYLSGALADYLSSHVWKWEIQITNSQFTGRFPQNKLCLQGAYLFSRFLLLFSFWIPRIFLILTSRPVPSSRLSLEAFYPAL